MGYADVLRGMFVDLDPVVDDLFLLEAHQIADLLHRVPAGDLAVVLQNHPRLHRFLVTRCPAVRESFAELLASQPRVAMADVGASEQAVVWEVADWIVYQRAPEAYDTYAGVDWTIAAVTELTSLTDKVVIDAGSGTGRVAFDASPAARYVFAVEPVAALRQFIRSKATRQHLNNLFVLDGFLHAIPLPPASADVLLTCQAIGWALPEELAEIERVVAPGGVAMHLFGTPGAARTDLPLFQTLVKHGYRTRTYQDDNATVHSYHKTIGV